MESQVWESQLCKSEQLRLCSHVHAGMSWRDVTCERTASLSAGKRVFVATWCQGGLAPVPGLSLYPAAKEKHISWAERINQPLAIYK